MAGGTTGRDWAPPRLGTGPAAGWYADPELQGMLRYWDGAAWTSDRRVAAVPPAPPTARPSGSASTTLLRGAFAAAGLLVVGAVGPWASALGIVTVNGMSTDGKWVAGLAAIALILLFMFGRERREPLMIGAIVCGVIAAAISIYDVIRIESATSDFFGSRIHVVQAEWGLYLCAAASFALSVAAGLLVREGRRSRVSRGA